MIEMTPKLCQLAKAGDPDSIPGALMEPKLDGHRMLAFITSDPDRPVRMYARSGVEKTGKLPKIERQLADLAPMGTILDGEVIHADEKGGDWAKVQTILGASSKQSVTLTFVVFDILSLMGEDIRGYTLSSRRILLEALFDCPPAYGEQERTHVRLIDQTPYDADAVAGLIDNGWEGAIIKDPNRPYRSGSRDWVKIKATETVDVVVMGATEGKGKFEGQIGALIFGEYVDGELIERGQCSGMDDAERAEFSQLWLDELADPTASTLTGMVIEVQHMGRMPSGGWRHPQFKRVRTDKPAAECVA